MFISYAPLGQGVPSNAEGAKEWLYRWRPLERDDRNLFDRVCDAAFLLRWGLGRYDCRNRVGVEVVFRSGEREFLHDVPPRTGLWPCLKYADERLSLCPALAADAICVEDSRRNNASWLALTDIDVYIDGIGTFHSGEELVALRNFDAVDPFWRRRLIEEHRLRRREFGLLLSEVNLLSDDEGQS